MERERLAREKQEEEKKKNQQKIKEEYSDTRNEWEKDKQEMQNLAAQPKPVRDAPKAPSRDALAQPHNGQPGSGDQVKGGSGNAAQGESKPQVVKQEGKVEKEEEDKPADGAPKVAPKEGAAQKAGDVAA
jgi:mannan polymerase II complex ANP1 subunit